MIFSEKLKDITFKESILDFLCDGKSELRDILEWCINYKISEFKSDFFEDVNLQELILPAITRVWNQIYLQPPWRGRKFGSIFKPQYIDGGLISKNLNRSNSNRSRKLELYQLSFNIEDFLNYLKEMLENNKNCLDGFEFLDKPSELVELICDNYIAKLVDFVNNSENLTEDIRNEKLKNILK
jgi:hypothetical protein